jgi:hypothetical protein
MNLFGALAKHGTAVVAGFLLGLLALALIEPATTNGKILLVVAVMCVAVVAGELVLLATRLARGREGKGGGEGKAD